MRDHGDSMSMKEKISELREEAYRKNSEEILEKVRTDFENGLSHDEVETRLQSFGLNEISEEEGSVWNILFDQFSDPLILLLIGAAVVSFLIGNFTDGFGISIAVLIVSSMGFAIEHKSEKSLQELKDLTSLEAKVLRNGEVKVVDSKELVPGDILILKQGDKVPADARIVEERELSMDESTLTGESKTVSKNCEEMEEKVSIMDRRNMVFSGTLVASGNCKAVVVGTGEDTEIGTITSITSDIEDETPLEKNLRNLGRKISRLAIGVCILIFVVGFIHGFDLLHLFTIAVSLAVAAIPEGLPITTTITLALGVKKMAEKKAIVRKLPSIETLGSVSKIFSDKTGTLTENMMAVRILSTVDKEYTISGPGSSIKGEFELEEDREINPQENERLSLALKIGALCNEAKLKEEDGSVSFVGDPTEGALLVAARKAGYNLEKLNEKYVEVKKVPFSSKRRRMVSVREEGDKRTAFCKGAPAKILDISSSTYGSGDLSEELKESILERSEELASKGMRVLALAKKEVDDVSEENLEDEFEFVGFVAMIDPAREGVMESVRRCENAGISVSMITGDNENTARAIAEEVGILDDGKVVTGDELEEMEEGELEDRISDISIFARTTPEQKLKILRVMKKRGDITAMTGDGVNDVPALKMADIGIAMGERGSDAAKEASDMTLTDDSFETITEAINYGRSVFQNIRKFLRFQLTTSMGAIIVISAATFIDLRILPMTAVQILWINVIMDGPPAISLGLEPPGPDIMDGSPRDPGENILTKRMMVWIGVMASVMGIATLLIFTRTIGISTPGKARTIAFTTFAFFQVFNVFNCRALEKNFWNVKTKNKYLFASVLGVILIQLAIIYLPPIQSIFGTTALGIGDWATVLGTAAVILPANILVLPILNKYFH